MFNIILYNCTAERERLDKTDYLSNPITLTGNFREETNIENPSLIVESSTQISKNYCYIEELQRYYFIDNITIVSGKLYRLNMSEDYRMTWKSGVRNLSALVARQQFNYNPLLNDTMLPVLTDPIVEYVDIPSNTFSVPETTAKNFVIALMGV